MGSAQIEQTRLAFERREAGTRSALCYSDDWVQRCVSIVTQLPSGSALDAESLRDWCGDPPKENTMGAVVQLLLRSGLIRKAGYRQATRASRHLAEIRVYRRV